MEQILSDIKLSYTNQEINDLLKQSSDVAVEYTCHFNQNEDYFIKLDKFISIPSFRIHHDVRINEPSKQYLENFIPLIDRIHQLIPDIFQGMTYIFDPAEVLRPAFFHLYKIGEVTYLYLLRIHLLFRPQVHEIITNGTNDTTPEYRTNQLVLEADFIPLEKVLTNGSKIEAFRVKQSVSDTWIGETGRGYFVQGIWLDRELTKFFTKLFIPKGKRIYPYYPFTCKYRAICFTVIGLKENERKAKLPLLHRATSFLAPHMDEIQDALKENEFSEDLECFQKLKTLISEQWDSQWERFSMDVYLNELDMREFRIYE